MLQIKKWWFRPLTWTDNQFNCALKKNYIRIVPFDFEFLSIGCLEYSSGWKAEGKTKVMYKWTPIINKEVKLLAPQSYSIGLYISDCLLWGREKRLRGRSHLRILFPSYHRNHLGCFSSNVKTSLALRFCSRKHAAQHLVNVIT